MADSATTPEEPVVMDGDVIVEFNEASSRQQINSGESVKTLFGKLKKFLTDLKAVAFSGAYSDLSGAPDLTEYATKAELDTKAEKELYGNYGINLGRLAGSTVGFLSSTMGRANAATGGYSFSQGFDNTASGVASFAGGQSSAAEGENALAHGYFVKTTKNNEKAFGAYNKSSSDTLFSVGDGTSDTDRHNAFEITTTGGKLHDKDIATTDLIPTTLPANGGTADTARQVTSSSSKVRLYEDGEGGNLRLVSSDGNHSMEMDLFNNEQFRMYFQDENGIVVPLNYNFTTKKLNINGDADTVDGKHASDFLQLADEMIINNIRINANQHEIADINYRWSIWTDGEGGNFELSAPDGSHFMQMDLFSNTDFRMFFGDRTTGKLNFPFFYRFDTGKIEINGTSDIYTFLNKPYVTGILSEQASDLPVTMSFTIFDFTPSKVICQLGNESVFFANVVTNGFSLTIPAGTTTIHYIAFK